eukprot:1194393-Prorocentrum_minimum.AAC.1
MARIQTLLSASTLRTRTRLASAKNRRENQNILDKVIRNLDKVFMVTSTVSVLSHNHGRGDQLREGKEYIPAVGTNRGRGKSIYLIIATRFPGGSCFLNSTMQSLLAVPLFSQFLHCLHRALRLGFLPPSCPVLRAMAEFVGEFLPRGGAGGGAGGAGEGSSKPFAPQMFDGLLRKFSPMGREDYPLLDDAPTPSYPLLDNAPTPSAAAKSAKGAKGPAGGGAKGMRRAATRQEDAQVGIGTPHCRIDR